MTSELKLLLTRLLQLVPTIFILLTVIFLIFNVIPGDAATVFLGSERHSQAQYDAVRHLLGLDRPLLTRYVDWLTSALQGNLGNSWLTGESVTAIILNRLPVTLLLSAYAIIIGIGLALPIGIMSALKRGTKYDILGTSASLLGISLPVFWFGLILIYFFSVNWHLLPPGGFTIAMIGNPVETIARLTLPALALGIQLTGSVGRITRSSMIEVLNQEFITTARAKGLLERTVIFKHAFKNAMIPVVTQIGLEVSGILGGAVITEQIFQTNGLGRLILNGVYSRDVNVVQGSILVFALMIIVVNLVVDLLYRHIDPRMRG